MANAALVRYSGSSRDRENNADKGICRSAPSEGPRRANSDISSLTSYSGRCAGEAVQTVRKTGAQKATYPGTDRRSWADELQCGRHYVRFAFATAGKSTL